MKKALLALMAALTLLPVQFSAGKKPSELKVISYNIRLGSADDGTNSWTYRAMASVEMINDQKPDIFGLQEAMDEGCRGPMGQTKTLVEYCPGYKCVGIGREDGKEKGEKMAIFWNKKTVKMIKWGTFWLSETPDEPSMGWDAACFRTATWALMKDKRSGKKFYYVNTHLDHVGWEARKKGLALIVERIASINPKGYPMVLTGDFNMTIDRPEFDDLKKIMTNARESAYKTDHVKTFHNWGKVKGDDKDYIIDYIWYSGFSSCPEYETITEEYSGRKFVSDHYPIKATLIF